MTTPPTYSIVGSGNVGSALARIFARAHVDVTIANTRGPESLRELTSELGPTVQAASITDPSNTTSSSSRSRSTQSRHSAKPCPTGRERSSSTRQTRSGHRTPTRSSKGACRASSSPRRSPEPNSSRHSTSYLRMCFRQRCRPPTASGWYSSPATATLRVASSRNSLATSASRPSSSDGSTKAGASFRPRTLSFYDP